MNGPVSIVVGLSLDAIAQHDDTVPLMSFVLSAIVVVKHSRFRLQPLRSDEVSPQECTHIEVFIGDGGAICFVDLSCL